MCKIYYEDNHLLVIEKPPGMLVQGDATGDDCLVERMKRYIGLKYQKPGAVYLGLIHRLDRPVGGLVIMARTGKAAARLSEQLRKRTMEREYLAVVHGCTLPDEGKLSDMLSPDPKSGNMRVISPPIHSQPTPVGRNGPKEQEPEKELRNIISQTGQLAILRFTTLARDQQLGRALVHVQLETGRKHQIRAQLAHFGYPIVQDMRYGRGVAGEPIALWGTTVRLVHPTLHKTMLFSSCPNGKAFERFGAELNAYLAPLTQEVKP